MNKRNIIDDSYEDNIIKKQRKKDDAEHKKLLRDLYAAERKNQKGKAKR